MTKDPNKILPDVANRMLFESARQGDCRGVAYALGQGANPDAPVVLGATSMRAGLQKGDARCLALMGARANPDARDERGRTLAMSLRGLPEQGARFAVGFCDLAALDSDRLSALHWAVASGAPLAILQLLLERGPQGMADAPNAGGHTPASMALRSGRWDRAEAVLAHSRLDSHSLPFLIQAAKARGLEKEFGEWFARREQTMLSEQTPNASSAKAPRL